jgi:hypothetical protein
MSLRKGKWTADEENYANRVISLFNRGLLPIPAGTTLRSYLSEKLNWFVPIAPSLLAYMQFPPQFKLRNVNLVFLFSPHFSNNLNSSDPMRISKKYAGASSVGKQVFQPCTEGQYTEAHIEMGDFYRFESMILPRLGLFVGVGGSGLLMNTINESPSQILEDGKDNNDDDDNDEGDNDEQNPNQRVGSSENNNSNDDDEEDGDGNGEEGDNYVDGHDTGSGSGVSGDYGNKSNQNNQSQNQQGGGYFYDSNKEVQYRAGTHTLRQNKAKRSCMNCVNRVNCSRSNLLSISRKLRSSLSLLHNVHLFFHIYYFDSRRSKCITLTT